MKKLNITWDGITDQTGYLLTFAKSLSCAVKSSSWSVQCEDIVATSGFAFRMWVNNEVCPSSTSCWNWQLQKQGIENAGFTGEYLEGDWDADDSAKREEALRQIKASINKGVPAVAWCVGIPEWGLIIGYDDERQVYSTLKACQDCGEIELPYTQLGRGDIPVLSVLTLTGKTDKPQEEILRDTFRLAARHLSGGESCENPSGLQVYPVLIRYFEESFTPDISFNLEYLIGTFASLKYYAWIYFIKMKQSVLSALYADIYNAWMESFKIKVGEDFNHPEVRTRIAALLRLAADKERKALEVMAANN